MLILDGIQNSNWCRRCQAKGRLHQSENSKRQDTSESGVDFSCDSSFGNSLAV